MVYLLHFDRKLKHAQHYIGFVDGGKKRLDARMQYHRSGRGSKLMKAVTEAGIGFVIANTWPDGDRNFERSLKNRKNARHLCNICKTK